jgi:hypothetical protein
MQIILIIPICLAAYGAALYYNLFGPAYSLADFYRGDAKHMLDEDHEENHRTAAWSMIGIALALTAWFIQAGLV